MEKPDVASQLLEAVDDSRRSFLRKLILGTAFVLPAINSFAMSGLSAGSIDGYVANQIVPLPPNLGIQSIGTDCTAISSRAGDFSGCDFTGQDLSNKDLHSLVLSGANFAGANLSNSDLSYCGMAGSNLADANLTNTNLTGANLANANLSNAKMTGAILTNANLSGANLTGATGFQASGNQ